MSDDPGEPKNGWLKKITSILSDNDQPENLNQAFLNLLHEYRNSGNINPETAKMMENLLDLHASQVRDVMIPRGQIVLIQDNWSLDKVLKVILDSGHSRYPVLDEDHEHILGILITKDLLPLLIAKDSAPNFLDVIRPATIVPESKPIDVMLSEFRTNRNHMALVIDEYGNLSGLVTIEDAIEQIVGEIDDEHDEIPDADYRQLSDGSYSVKALMTIEDFNEAFHASLSDEDADTIGGYVLHILGHMPVAGETLDIEHWKVTVTKTSQRRILLMNLAKKSLVLD